MALVRRACDLFWNCFAWSSDDESEQIVREESVPPIRGIPQTGVDGRDDAGKTTTTNYEERLSSLGEAIRRLSAENEVLRAEQVETNDTMERLRQDLIRTKSMIDKQGSQILSVNEQMRYTIPRDFVAYDGNQSSQRTTIVAIYPPNYSFEE